MESSRRIGSNDSEFIDQLVTCLVRGGWDNDSLRREDLRRREVSCKEMHHVKNFPHHKWGRLRQDGAISFENGLEN